MVAGTLWSATDTPAMAGPPGEMEQTGTLRPLAGAHDLSFSSRNVSFGQTASCFPAATGVEGEDYCLDLPVAAYVTFPRSCAGRAMICSPPMPRTTGNSRAFACRCGNGGRTRGRTDSGRPRSISIRSSWSTPSMHYGCAARLTEPAVEIIHGQCM